MSGESIALGPYLLGPNDDENCGIYTGDARELAKAIPDESVDLIIADPPYFRIANEDWDKQWKTIEAWADWCLEWGREAYRVLRSNGSAYIFGDDKNSAYVQVRFDGLAWGLINSIVWSKTNYTALKADPEALRSFRVQAEERILFYGRDISFPSFSEIRNPMAATPMGEYLRNERHRAGVPMRIVAALFPSETGGLTGCVSNWELGYNFPLKWQYEAMRDCLNKHGKKPPEYLRAEYEDLRAEYEDLRRPFYGYDFTDVWDGPLMNGAKKRHVSEKPRWLIDRMILASSKPGAIVLDLFTGSGTIAESAIQLGRRYLAFEIEPTIAEQARQRVRETQPPLFVLEPEQMELPDA